MTSNLAVAMAEAPARNQLGLASGTIIDDRYEVTRALGAGGMGEVYEVVHLGLRKPFALKCLKQAALHDARAAQRFVREIRGLASVQSEFVVGVCDCGRLPNGAPYFVMQRLRGHDLRKLLLEVDSLTPVRAMKLAIDACLGLQAVHEAGLVHRDLKPENLFVTLGDDGSERCKVLDFGVAKTIGLGSTHQHSILGTLKYMAPEQLADPNSVGPATDIYSLGAILYECLAARPPHVGETEPELMFKIMNADPVPLNSLLPSLDATLVSLVARALQRDPERRYASAVSLAGALASCLVAYGEEAQTQDLEQQLPSSRVPDRRHWTLGALAVGVVLGAGLGSWSKAWSMAAPNPPRSNAVSVAPRDVPVEAANQFVPPRPSTSAAEPAPARPRWEPSRTSAPGPTLRNVVPTLPAIDEQNPYE